MPDALAAVVIDLPERGPFATEEVQWAAGELVRALQRRGVASGPSDHARRVQIALGAKGEAVRAAAALSVTLPDAAEALALLPVEDGIIAWGSDTRGLVYALTELADRVNHHRNGADIFGLASPLVEAPTARVRSIARLFCSEAEDKSWFHDRQFWHAYLTMLATHRFNRFSLTLGMGYNYPYHNNFISDVYFYFPYPFLFDMAGYPIAVRGISDEERDGNLETLKFIARETQRRGLDFHVALWTQRYDFDDVPNAMHEIDNVTSDNLAPYCRDAITRLLQEVPQIRGLTFRVHVEGGIAEGDYGFWKEAFAGVTAAGRPIEIDMHAKGLDHETIGIARASGMPIAASPKYMGEHMGLPYHQSAIRELEYPPERPPSEREQLSEGSRKFLRYSYGDLLARDRDWKVFYRIWAGSQRVLLWGDPAFAAGYGRSSIFCGSDGVELCEPGSFKGRMATGLPGQRFNYQVQSLATRYDFEKYAYQYRVWGRGLYCPDAPRESWMRYLEATCGDAAAACEQGLALASRVIPLVSLTHAPSASNNQYWPEIYSNLPVGDVGTLLPHGRDMGTPVRFGNAPTFDPQLFSTPLEYAAALHRGETDRRYTPLDVADWLERLADGCDDALCTMKRATAFQMPEVQRIAIDVGILAGMARFFAEKFRASVWVELFIIGRASCLLDRAETHLARAHLAWKGAADISRDVYHDDLTYGRQSWLRGSWHQRLREIELERSDIQAMRRDAPHETVHPDETMRRAIAAIDGRQPTRAGKAAVAVKTSTVFEPGAAFEVRAVADANADLVLHYRHVNQAERWQSITMKRDGGEHTASIPAAYTQSPFHLQFYVTAVGASGLVIAPGLDADLANEPYLTVLAQ